jgi:PAS domain S-box-containing protein
VKAAWRRITGVDLAVAVYGVGYLAWLLARSLGFAVSDVGVPAFHLAGLLVAWANWRNSRAAGLDSRTRTAWRLLALGSVILWASGSAWMLYLATGNGDRYPDWIDQTVYLQYAAWMAGYLCFPGRRLPRIGLTRLRLDIALVVVAGFVIAAYFSLRLLFLDPAESTVAAVVDSSLDWALFALAGIGVLQKRNREIRRAMLLLLGASFAYMAGNWVLSSVSDYHNGDPVDALWFLGWVLRWIAARQAWGHYAAGRAVQVAATGERRYRSSRLSHVIVGGALALLLSRVIARDEALLEVVAVAAMIMGTLLVLRQFAEMEENRRLFRAQIQNESRFRSLVQKSSDVVLIVNPDGVVTYVSPSVGRVLGEKAQVAAGKSFRELLPPEDAGVAVTLLDGTPQASPHFETRLESAPGVWRDVELSWTDLREDPWVGGVVVSCRDITERHEYERYLRQAHELDAVGHLAGGLAHDLNNLLMVIRGYAELLRAEWSEDSPFTTDLDHVISAVDRAASVTARVLAFSRKQPVRRKRLDLNAVIDNVQPMLSHVTREPMEIRLRLDAALWPVRADQGQMEQVLVNLVSNAGDAMPRGGDIQVATANRTIGPATPETGDLAPGDYVALTVADRGIGMSPDISARAFEPFFSTKPSGQGLGLGLAIVRGIVNEMDGHVAVQSQEGRGSTFTVLLPRAEAE